MADIAYSISMKVEKEFLSNSVSVGSATASMSQVGMSSATLALNSNPTSISTANLTSVGLAFVRNLSTATGATCAIGISGGGSFLGFCTLRAGEPAIFRLSPGTDYSAVGAAGSRLRVDITEG